MVRYKTAEAQASVNAALVRAVFDELRARSPKGFRYATFRLADGVSFVHVATMEGENPLATLPAFQAFTADIKARCVEPPVVTELSVLDHYKWEPLS